MDKQLVDEIMLQLQAIWLGAYKSEILIAVAGACIGAVMLMAAIVKMLRSWSRRQRFTVRRNRRSIAERLTALFSSNRLADCLMSNAAARLGMLNGYSYDKNREFAALMIIPGFLAVLAVCGAFLPSMTSVWYISFGYIVIALVFTALMLYLLSLAARQRFTSKMPSTYKLLNSRYIITGNILKAISLSMDDFDKPVRKVMIRIHDVLRKNDIGEINNTFSMLERLYDNEYLTLLLNLISQAYYKGGNGAIKKQFEETTEEIMLEIENRMDLNLTSRTYIVLSLFLPFGMKWLELFNYRAIGADSVSFYGSPAGIQLKIVFFIAFFIYIGILLLMERTTL